MSESVPESLASLYTAASGESFEALLDAARDFWPHMVLPPDPEHPTRVILVDIQCTDLRVAVRTLTYAQALRRVVPARLVAFSGIDPVWSEQVWASRDAEAIVRLAVAYGADQVLDFNDLIDRLHRGEDPEVDLAGAPLRIPPAPEPMPPWFEDVVRATAARLLFVPRLDDALRNSPEVCRIADRSRDRYRINAGLLDSLDVVEVVTSHVDYADWGLLVEQAMHAGIPVTHVQSTGAVKAYTVFPEARSGEGPVRAHTTRSIADEFETRIWPRRAELRPAAELTAWRSRQNLGRPSWWRYGADSVVPLRSDAERAALRRQVATRFGWDPATPVISVFNHAVSDALGTNAEAFSDLADWFEQTAAHAASHPEVNWLFLDHPAQHRYDRSEFFAAVSQRHHEHEHMVFRASEALSKTALWSLTDLAVTVRGSVSNEFPAFGVPALQAGWSEWSSLGFTTVAETEVEYWSALTDATAALLRGEALIDDEQVERARLWLWLYRSGADVPSALVPSWQVNDPELLGRLIGTAMQHLELDADPLFTAVRRAALGHQPWLTRVDFDGGSVPALLGSMLDDVHPGGRPAEGWLSSPFDPPPGFLAVGEDASTGRHPGLAVLEHVTRGVRIVGQARGVPASVAIRVHNPTGRRFRVVLHLGLDAGSDRLWETYAGPAELPEVHRVDVHAQGSLRTTVELHRPAGGLQPGELVKKSLSFLVRPGEVGPDGLVVIDLRDADHGGDHGLAPIGVRISRIAVRPPIKQD